MKKTTFILLALNAIVVTSCAKNTNRRPCNIVEERFVHKYGMEVEQKDWQARGNNGQVITKLDDGVILTQTFKDGQLDGITTYTHSHSEAIEVAETYVNGQLTNRVTNNDLGRPQEEVDYTPDGFEIVTTWFEGGTPQSREMFKSNQLVEGQYFTSTNQLESRVDNGQGTRLVRNNYGDLVSKDLYESGHVVMKTSYHPNGAPKAMTPYVNNKPNGERKTFLPAGEPDKIEQWVGGKQHGLTLTYKNGEKRAEVPFLKGKKHGVEKRFRNGSTVVQELTWKDGYKHGPVSTYIDGEETKTVWYHKGKSMTESSYKQKNKTR
jgi:antitoxin component YwqK of YwqJK toxin-antitoxin module